MPGARPEEPPAETCKVPEHDCDVTGLELELKPSAGPSDVKAKRCKNCKKWYAVDELATDAKQEPGAEGSASENEETACRFHSGVFRREGQSAASGMINFWSCCKDRDINAPGCKYRKHHVEDRSTTAILEPFVAQIKESPYSADLARRIVEGQAAADEHAQSLQFPPKAAAQRKDVESKSKESNDHDGNLVHAVQYNDTIQGLALKFGVTTQAIKKANGLMGDHIACYSTLIIPQREVAACPRRARSKGKGGSEDAHQPPEGEGQERKRAAARVAQCRGLAARMTRLGDEVGEHEASAYLAMAEEDAQKAFELYQQDLEWQRRGALGPDENFKKMLQECVLAEVVEDTRKKLSLWQRIRPRCFSAASERD